MTQKPTWREMPDFEALSLHKMFHIKVVLQIIKKLPAEEVVVCSLSFKSAPRQLVNMFSPFVSLLSSGPSNY